MKNIRTFLAVFFLTAAGTANATHAFSSTLLFHHRDYQPVIVELDYLPGSNHPRTEFTFTNVSPGRHSLRVYRVTGNYNHQNRHLLYNGHVDVPAASMVNTVLHNRTLRIVSVVPLPVYEPAVYYNPAPVYTPAACINGMDPRRYEALKASIAARPFDSTRLNLARQAVKNNPMSSAQIAGLTELLSFDSSRLNLAKYAYGYVTDPQNYFTLFDLFAFDSSVRELSEYMDRFG